MSQKQSYQEFLQNNLQDRNSQKAYLKQIRETDTRFKGLSEEQSANVLADATGFEPLRRFAQSGLAQGLDAFGNYITNATTDFRLGDVTRVPQGIGQLFSGGSEQKYGAHDETRVSDITGGLAYGAAKGVGFEESTAQAFKAGGESAPAVIGQIGMGFIPGVGLPAMMSSMYGQGLDAAYAKGEFGARGHISASVGPLATAVTMGLARPFAGAAADKVMSFGTSEAIKDGMKIGGELGLRSVLSNSSVSASTKVALKAGQETLVQLGQSGIGIAADLTQNAILDPDEFFNETIKDKQYWIPMIMSEVIEGAGGSILGRKRYKLEENPDRVTETPNESEPSPTQPATGEPVVAKKSGEKALRDAMTPPEQTIPNPAFNAKLPVSETNQKVTANPEWEAFQADLQKPLYSDEAKIKNDVDPLAPDSEAQLLESVAQDAQVASGVMTQTIAEAKSAIPNPDFDPSMLGDPENVPILPATESSYVHDPTHVLDIVARFSSAAGRIDIMENPAHRATETIVAALENSAEGVDPHQAISNVMEHSFNIAGKEFKDHRIETDAGNYLSLVNPGTKEHGVLLHFRRGGQTATVVNESGEVSASKFILRPEDMLGPMDRADFDKRSQLKEPMTYAEWNTISALGDSVKKHYMNIPYGVSFADGHDAAYVQKMTEFLQKTGIQNALMAKGRKLRFGREARKIDQSMLTDATLDYFSAMNRANNTSIGPLSYISRNDGFSNETDMHELGHTVGDLISEGAFGNDVAKQWNEFLSRASKFEDDGKIAVGGARMGMDLTGRVKDDDSVERVRQHFLTNPEISAQTFQGYVLGQNTPFKTWIAKTFPKLHDLFTRLMKSLNVVGDADATTANRNFYSPEFQEGRDILAGIFNSQYRKAEETTKGLKALVKRHGLHGQALDSVTRAWYADVTPDSHKVIVESVAEWKKGLFDPTKATEGEMADLADGMAQFSNYITVNSHGHMPAGDAIWGMPWIRKLAGANLSNIATAIRGKMEDPTLLANLNKVFMTPQELTFIKNNLDNWKDKDAMKRAGILNRNRTLLQLNAQHVTKAIDELVAIQGENRVKGSQVVKQMFQVDNVVKKWMLGKLPGQNGVPFFDENSKIFATELTKGALAQTGKAHTFHYWFPLLSKELKKAVTKSKVVEETTVSFDGSIVFGRKGSNTKRKVFDDLKDANDYVDKQKDMASNQSYSLSVKPETNKKSGATKYYVSVKKVERDSRYVDEMTDVDAWQNDAIELLNIKPENTGQRVFDSPEATADAYRSAMRVKKEAYVKEHGPAIMRKVGDIVPQEIKHLSETGMLNPKITAYEKKFGEWLKQSKDNANKLKYFAKHLGLKGTASPIEVTEAWLKLQLDAGKPQQKADALLALNWVDAKYEGSDSGLNDYIMSMHNYAKEYTRVKIAESMFDLANPKSRNHMPEVDPSEHGAEARLAAPSILNDPNVASGVAAASRSVPGGLEGDQRTPEQNGRLLKQILGTPLGYAQKLHQLLGTGAIHHGLANPVVKPLAEFIHEETGRANAWTKEVFSSLFYEGEVVDDPNLRVKFAKDARNLIDKNSEIYQIKRSPKLDDLHQEIMFLEQQLAMPIGKVLQGEIPQLVDDNNKPVDPKELIAAAQDVWSRVPDADKPTIHRALERRYAAQATQVHRAIEEDKFLHVASFALSIKDHDAFKGSASKAHEFAKRFASLRTEDRGPALIKELNTSVDEAIDTVEGFAKVEDAMQVKHDYMNAHLEYVTESRMKDFHVGVVFKADAKGLVPAPGYYDFDTAAEAFAFIEEQKKLGNKVPNAPKDFSRQRWNYKPISGSMNEIIERVTNQRRDLVDAMTYGKIDPKNHALIIEALSNQAKEINIENDVVVAGKTDMARRKFTAGRENLDMIEQFKQSTQRRAAAMTRRRTDILFKLYENDESMLKERELFNIMDTFREDVRRKDTEAQKVIGQAGFTVFMMGNISSAVVEVAQFPITLSPMLMEAGASVMDSYKIPAKMMKYATHAALRRLRAKSDDDIWEGPHLRLLREAELQGRSNQRKHHELAADDAINKMVDQYDSATDERGIKKSATHVAGATYKFLNDLYAFFNRINAELSMVSAFEVLKKTKHGSKAVLTDAQEMALFNEAMLLSDAANGSLQRLGRPSFMNSKRAGVRNAGSMYWSLQSFVNAQVANQLRFMVKSVNKDGKFTKAESVQARKAMVGLLGVQFTGMGIMGFTLMPAMAKIVKEAFGFDLEEEMREFLYTRVGQTESEKLFITDLASDGLLSAMGSPIDYGSRISIGGIGPLSGFQGIDANQLGGPLLSVAANAFKDMQKVRAGNMDLGEGALNLLPMGLRRGIRMSFFDDGSVYDTQKRFMFNANGAEKFGAWLGFAPLRHKKAMKARMANDEAVKADTSRKSSIASDLIRARDSGSYGKMQELIAQGSNEFDMDPYDFVNFAAGKDVDKQKGPDPREGAGPNAVRAKKLYPSPLDTVGHEERLHATAASIQSFGMAPKVSRTAQRRARMLDYMQRADPSMTTGTASNMLRNNPQMKTGFSQLLGL